jgi:26S proteasome regulatory subunit N6|eukprot:Transcript_9452.p1 GENE.Transcript_9452~~Transcript_9452.p1  ORF type:complete len:226 (-),score=63.73 Transcript_9452:136-738(-)
MEAQLTAAAELAGTHPAQAATAYESLIMSGETSEEAVKVKEQAIYQLGDVYAKQGEASKLGALLTNLRPFFATIPKAKTAKIVRTLIDQVAKIPDSRQLQMSLCRESIEWCKAEKRSFLRQRIQSRLAALLLEAKQYTDALALLSELLYEVSRSSEPEATAGLGSGGSLRGHAAASGPRLDAPHFPSAAATPSPPRRPRR